MVHKLMQMVNFYFEKPSPMGSFKGEEPFSKDANTDQVKLHARERQSECVVSSWARGGGGGAPPTLD